MGLASASIAIVLLKGINVGGHRMVPMVELRGLLADLGLADARTLLQSGNVVFRGGGARTAAALERLLESEAEKRFGMPIPFFMRSAKEWKTLIARNPFPKEAERDPSHLLVMLLKDAPDAKAVRALQAAIAGSERVRADGRQLYAVYTNGIGRSPVTGAFIERELGTSGTARNWNTVLKLDALAAAL